LTPPSRHDDNSGMDDKPTKRGGGAVVVMVLVAMLVLLPIIYVLSIGPTYWLVRHGHLDQAWEYEVYWPVHYVCAKSLVLKRWLYWYQDLWVEPLPVGMIG
jgi:hypothetical protein